MNTQARTRTQVTNRMMQVAVALMVAVGLTGLGVTTAGAAKPDRAFGAVVTGTITSTGETTFTLTGVAFSPGLGQMDYHGEVTIEGIDPQTGVITDVLIETFTTARGDTFTIHCDQIATPLSPGVYLGDDTWSVVGGTGKFGDATGEGTGATHVDLNTLTFTKVLAGTISQGR